MSGTESDEVKHLREALTSAVELAKIQTRTVAWLRGGGYLLPSEGTKYYDADEVEAHLASYPPDDFKPKLTTRKS